MAGESVQTGSSVASKSKVAMTNLAGQVARVDSVTSSTITVDALDIVNQESLYGSSEPGMLVIVDGQAAGDEGKTANITAISGTDITVDTDLSSGLGGDDLVAVIPPLANELNTDGGATLSVTMNKDENLGLTEGVLTHNSLISYDTGGDLPIFASIDSPGLGRLLLSAIGTHKVVNTDEHQYVPAFVNDGTYTENDELTVYTQDGDGVVREAWLGLMATSTQINVPRNGVATLSQTTQGTEVIREVGGTGKEFPNGSNNWDTGEYPCDTGKRFAARGALVQLGGTFGNGVDKSLMDPYFQELTINITRDPTDVRPLGNPARAKPEEDTHMLEISGSRLLEDSTVYDDFYGEGATPDDQTEDRFVARLVNPQDETKFLEFDVPKGVYTVDDVQRQRGQFEESFTYQAIQTKDSDGCIDTANPLYRAHYSNGDTTSYHDSL